MESKESWVAGEARAGTINGPSLSTDLAQRSITIKLGKPKHSGNWLHETAAFIAKYKTSIIAGLMELLRQPAVKMESHTRWGGWEQDVLCRLNNAELLQEAILQRQKDLDAEQDEANLLLEYFEKQLLKNNMMTNLDKILIPSGTAADWLNGALGEKHSKTSAGRMLNQKINEGRLPRLERAKNPERIDQSTRKERGFWWVPEDWDSNRTPIRPGGMATFDVNDWAHFV